MSPRFTRFGIWMTAAAGLGALSFILWSQRTDRGSELAPPQTSPSADSVALPQAPSPIPSSPESVTRAPVAPGSSVTSQAGSQECRTITFKHKTTRGHEDMESCGGHRNKLTIAVSDLNPKSLCVRVDGTPVKFEVSSASGGEGGKNWHITLPPIAGPGSKISARFGTGKLTCKEDCTIPKDEFLAALGAEAERAPAGKWKGKGAKKNVEVSAELEAEVDRELGAGGDEALPVFGGWVED